MKTPNETVPLSESLLEWLVLGFGWTVDLLVGRFGNTWFCPTLIVLRVLAIGVASSQKYGTSYKETSFGANSKAAEQS